MSVGTNPTWKLARRTRGIFAYTGLDILPVLAARAHLIYRHGRDGFIARANLSADA